MGEVVKHYWQLIMRKKEETLIKDLINKYKAEFLNVSLDGPKKEGERADELYKWVLITSCKDKSVIEVISALKETNVVDIQRVKPVISDLLSNNSEKLAHVFELLTDEDKDLYKRLANFKIEMADLCGERYKVKANDERTAAAFLACFNPQKYTFYKDEIYQNYCKYIGEQPKNAGEKYPHYLELLQPLVQVIKKDKELTDKFEKETKGLTQSDLLIAQNILWQMKDIMKEKKEDGINFWSGGIKWNGSETDKLEDFNKSGFWQIGWDKNSDAKGAKQAWSNILQVKKGDYMAFHGYGGRNDLIIYQISRVTGKDEERGLLYFEKISSKDEELYSGKAPKMSAGNWFGTLFPILGDEAIKTIFGKILNKLEEMKRRQIEEIEKYTNILSLKKNIILQGAPGTGKTYNTAALALAICDVKDVDFDDHEAVMERYEKMLFNERSNPTGQIGFCTFHQSMDYEDFVEGIKPDTDNGTISYDVEHGLFKRISEKAKENKEDSEKTIEQVNIELKTREVFDDYCQNILLQLSEKDSVELYSKSELKIRRINLKKDGTPLSIQLSKVDGGAPQNLTWEMVSRDYNDFKSGKIKSFEDVKPRYESKSRTHGNARYYFELYKKLAAFEKENKTDNVVVEKVALQNYVLIIDEINRGNVSKIFGELITLLEADKRIGGDHPIKVTLPYSKEEFGVPSNLYIIGTMNTTDRSVGNIDYAVRRRFAFVTLESKREIVAEKCGEDSKAVQLFDAVKKFLQSNKADMDFEDLMVGHSYFMAKDENELSIKWRYEILPLLNEYIKDGIVNYNGLIAWNTAIEDFINQWQSDTTLKAQADTPNQD